MNVLSRSRRICRLLVEPLTEESFEPFGWVIAAPLSSTPTFAGPRTRRWAIPFEISGDTQICVLYTEYAPNPTFDVLENHSHVSQAFIPLTGRQSVVAVAERTSAPTRPPAEKVKAFAVAPGSGYVLRRGTWHTPERYPTSPPGAAFALITELETTQETPNQKNLIPSIAQRSSVVEYSSIGVAFAFEDWSRQ